MFHTLAAKLRLVLPPVAFNSMRRVATAALTPFLWTTHTGHWRSSLAQKPTDRDGQIVPWYTYPAIDFLSGVDFSDKKILEIGAGYSTLWWAKRASRIVALEDNKEWAEKISPLLPTNAALVLADTHPNGTTLAACEMSAPYDVIVIDGLDRGAFASECHKWLASDGVVIVDNSNGFWGREGTYPILDHFRAEGFKRVDFYGHAPAMSQPSCTSLFFKDSFVFNGRLNTRIR